MSYTKGIVEAISMKEIREGKHGQFANYGIKIGEDWFNGIANKVKSLGRVAVVDSSWNEVKNGMEIEFMYDTDQYGNQIQKKTMKILASGSSVEPRREHNSPPVVQTPTENKTDPNKEDFLDIMADEIATGFATSLACWKFHGKEFPNNIGDGIARMAKEVKNRYFKK